MLWRRSIIWGRLRGRVSWRWGVLRRWLSGRSEGRIITLIKPHYEQSGREAGARQGSRIKRGVLDDAEAERTARRVVSELESGGVAVAGVTKSPLRGGASKGHQGNVEYLALVICGS